MKKFLMFSFVFFLALSLYADTQEKSEYPSIDKYIKDMDAHKSFITIYQKDEKVYALIPNSQFGKPFLLAMTIATGVYAGMQWDHMMVYWEKQDKQLLLVRPDLRYRAPKTTMEDVLSRTFPSTIIRSVPILSVSGTSYLVDLSSVFRSDVAGLSLVAPFLLGGQMYFNSNLTSWSKVKVFPKNIELGVNVAFTGQKFMESENFTDQTDLARTYKVGVHYSLATLERSSYKPRIADTRIGYFNVAVKDFSKKYDERTKFVRYINRWNLEKVDSSLELSPPKDPIIFYIENTVPYQYRKYVKEAILEWNKALEKIGFTDAIIVRQQTDTDFANLDPEDARYNFFRWTTNEMGFAAGPSRTNPVTGEILDADIIFDDSMLRYATRSYAMMDNAISAIQKDHKFVHMCEKLEKINPLRKLNHMIGKKAQEQIAHEEQLRKIMENRNIPLCNYGKHKQNQLRMAHMFMKAKGKKKLPIEFVGQFIKETVMHEVGHTLGLYHNFKGSSWLPLSKINSEEKPAATTGSVMDYNPINFAPKGKPQGNYATTTIGPYDYWAIEYGYSQFSSLEESSLDKIAQRSAEDGLQYGNDLYATTVDPDPTIFRWDLGNDAIAYANQNMELLEQLSKDLLEKNIDQGEDFYPVRAAFNSILSEYAYNCIVVSRSIGGQYLHWDHKGDPNARSPFVVVPAKKQRDSLDFLMKTIFAQKGFSPEVLNHLAPGTWWHWGTEELDVLATYPTHDMVVTYQNVVLFNTIEPLTLMRLHNSPLQVKEGEDVFTLAEHLDGLTNGIWSELDAGEVDKKYSNTEPFISSFRRNLQRSHLDFWIYYLVNEEFSFLLPADAKSIAMKNLEELLSKIEDSLKNSDNLDSASLAHLKESKYRIVEFIEQ